MSEADDALRDGARFIAAARATAERFTLSDMATRLVALYTSLAGRELVS
jgi:hypothetical protein